MNVAGGSWAQVEGVRVVERLRALGFTVHAVPGPLLLSTTGGRYPLMRLLPLSVQTTFAPTKALLDEAWRALNPAGGTGDPDLELPDGAVPRWTTHSLRRLADTVARRYAAQMGVSEQQIDIYFGWHEKLLLKNMQIHYASLNARERMLLARITGML